MILRFYPSEAAPSFLGDEAERRQGVAESGPLTYYIALIPTFFEGAYKVP